MKHISLLVLSLLLHLISWSQTGLTQTVRGVILDVETQYPLVGAVAVYKNGDQKKGAISDKDGLFKLEGIPVGRQTIEFSFIGYKNVTRTNILVSSSKEIVLTVYMEQNLSSLNEVVVRSRKDRRKPINELATVSSRTLTMEETSKFSGSLADVARMTQNYAGVSGSSDDRNDIIVRGNSPSGVLWRLEGVDIPSPNHWSTLGTTGGPISMLNANNLKTSDFLTGAFPAEYGNATAAVFDLRLRNGNAEKYEFLGQIGFNGFEIGIEGPLKIGKNASFIANYRYSTLGVFSALGIDLGTGTAVPEYQDLNFKVNVPTEKAGIFKLWGLGGLSYIEFTSDTSDANLFSQSDQNVFTGAKTGMLGFGHKYYFNKNTSSDFNLALTTSISSTTAEEILDRTQQFSEIFESDNAQNKIVAHWTFNKRINTKNILKAGIIYELYDMKLVDSVLLDDEITWFSERDFNGSASLIRPYTQWQHKFGNRLRLNLGLHAAYFELNSSSSIEPRFGLSYETSSKSSISLGYGRHSQLQPLPIYFIKNNDATDAQNQANEDLDLLKSNHLIASWDYLINPRSRIKLETYVQQLEDIAVDPLEGDFSIINSGAAFGFPDNVGLVNEGTGVNYGFEITAERFLNDGFYLLSTLSVFESKYKGFDRVERSTYYNSNYVYNLLAGKEFTISDQFTLTLDAKFNIAGGRRYTPIDLQASILAGEEVTDNSRIFKHQHPTYIRPDFKIGFRHNAKKYYQVFAVDMQNFIGRRNIFGQTYEASSQQIKTTYQRGFLPDVRYQIFF